jgi:hypothetical protein
VPTTEINSVTTPESTGKPVVHEDLIKISRQHVQHEVMTFASAAERTAVFATLGITPNKGALSYLQDAGRYEDFNGSAWEILVAPNAAAISNVGSAGTQNLTSYADMPATSSMTFVKAATATAILVHMNVVWFTTVTVTAGMFGVRINGVDYDVGKLMINEANVYRQFAGLAKIPAAAVPAGAYTMQMRWRQHTGTGTLTVAADSWWSMSATEVR